jgi:hypothetical protein
MSNDHQKEAQDAAEALVRALVPALREMSDEPTLPSFVTLAKPYLRTAMSRVEDVRLQPDRRASQYHVSAMFWYVENGMEEAELECSTEEDGESKTVWSMAEALKLIWQWIEELHEGEELSEEAGIDAISKRVGTLKTSIMRGNGVGDFRVQYLADGHAFLCHATVRRVEG